MNEISPRDGLSGAWVMLIFPLMGVVMAGLIFVGPPERPLGTSATPTPIPQNARIGQPAPDFSADTPDGQTYTLSQLRGSPVAINFWATWCAPCEAEMPALQDAQRRHADPGLTILAVNGGEPPEVVTAFMDDLGLTFPALLDPDGEIADLYGVHALPTTVFVDAQGNISAVHLGPLTDGLIDRYLRGMDEGT
jgi:peroxiredoxin